MLIKTAVALTAAAVATAQGLNDHIMFSSPVGPGVAFLGGQDATFSWINPCIAPYTSVSETPTRTEVQLIDATNRSNAFFIQTVGFINCNISTQGAAPWSVPVSVADASRLFSLRIFVNPAIYSDDFQILGGTSLPTLPSTTVYGTQVPLTITATDLMTSVPPFPSTTLTTSASPGMTNKSSSAGENSFSNGSTGSVTAGAIAGIIVGVLAVLIAIVYILWKRRRHTNKISSPAGEEESRPDAADVTKVDGELKGDPTTPAAPVLMEEKRGFPALAGSQPQYMQEHQHQQQQQQQQQRQQSTAEEEEQLKQQKGEEIRRQIQQLQLQLEEFQGQKYQEPEEGPSSPSMTVGSYTPAPFQPPVMRDSRGNQEHLRENLQLSNHPRPNVTTTIQ